MEWEWDRIWNHMCVYSSTVHYKYYIWTFNRIRSLFFLIVYLVKANKLRSKMFWWFFALGFYPSVDIFLHWFRGSISWYFTAPTRVLMFIMSQISLSMFMENYIVIYLLHETCKLMKTNKYESNISLIRFDPCSVFFLVVQC